jgi:hypothetical protein
MSNELEPKPIPNQPVVYQIRLKGHLGSQWTDWFDGLTITLEEDGNTLLTGPVIDQAALHGLIKKVRDLGMPLVSVVQFNNSSISYKKRRKEMNTNKNIARMMGWLYIIGTISGILSRVVTGTINSAPDLLASISANGNPIILGALFVLTMGLALAMIPVIGYPVLRKRDEILALGYVVFRGALESVYYMAIFVSWLLLLPLSQVYQAGSQEASNLLVLANVLLETKEIAVFGSIVFCLGGLMFYYLLFKSKLVPQWLSGWGFIALILGFTAGLLVMFGFFGPISTISDVLQIPIFVQEMVLAVWLIVKGFNPSAITALSAKTE